ncbi:MAG: ArgE/DapE family deacylase [Melioribacteraceae bacterium]|nr:ArgE/DapE family deacylase [Melioribacteraceae bacterium]MCF8356862.1 ArgE/DapE family deacylase [Melioribacteraceae bacterium]MCF8394881.1 ArgE/DapE family deacylase [Melioribacteraceae bacterium]MCF8420414.1 ArgE/DapE family deacylase [Melioribacteraceae bacterium]
MKIDKNFVITTLQKLVRINSINPMLSSGTPGEKEICCYIADVLKTLNLNPEIQEISKNRFNVTAVIKGTGSGKSLLLNAHTDTVGVENMNDPFSGKISDGKLFGRGAYDMKGSIAAMLAAAKAMVDNKTQLKGDLVIAFVADEEYDSIGTNHLLKTLKTDGAIITEPSNLDICIAHRGFGLYEIITKGKVAHGGRPDLGIDANMQMGKILHELNKISQELKKKEPHALLGRPSLHIPVIGGGTEPFTYSGKCKIILERRTIPGNKDEECLAEINNIIEKLSEEDQQFDAQVKQIMWRDPFETSKESELINKLSNSSKSVLNKEPVYIGHAWWEDSALTAKKGIDTVIIGPRGEGLHTANEWVEIESVNELAEILYQTAINFCK